MKSYSLILLFICLNVFGQEKNQILVVGTFHFHLATSQFGVEFDINDDAHQSELENMANQISLYKPTKIFVEWDYAKQPELDELFNLYMKDKSFAEIKNKFGANETMYFDSEVQQLGFRIADKMNQSKLYAFDYMIPEPNDTIMQSITKHNQLELLNDIQREFQAYGQNIISKFQETNSIKELLLFFNSEDLENQLNSGYVSLFNRVGSTDDFSGAYFVSERYRRNLYMYSMIQKQIEPQDERVLVIVGAQHAAGFRELIKYDNRIERVSLELVLDNN